MLLRYYIIFVDMSVKFESGIIKAKLDKTSVVLADGISFEIEDGKSLAMIGETGSGKTIVACAIMKLLPVNVSSKGGRFVFCGEDLSNKKNINKLLGREIVYIPQCGHENLNPTRKVKYHLYDSLRRIGVKRKELRIEAENKLEKVGFENPKEIMEKYPFELSGGMAQRVVIAIGLCSRAKFVIADEPTNGLENEKKFEFLNLIKELFPQASKLVITHDISVAESLDDVIVLCKGKVMEKGRAKDVLDNPFCPFTKALISALVKNGMQETPIIRENKGPCPFYARCKNASDACAIWEVCNDKI